MHEHSVWEFLRVGFISCLAGGGGLRFAMRVIRKMPKPLPGERWYEWLYDVLQDWVCDNQDLKGARNLQTFVKAAGEQ